MDGESRKIEPTPVLDTTTGLAGNEK